jgi:hypothetical protein
LYPDRGIRGYWGFSSAAVAASFNQGLQRICYTLRVSQTR